ncbi:MAG: methyltransferase type 11, partial [Eubacterium sp.]
MSDTHETVKEYYSSVSTEKNGQLETSVCCCSSHGMSDQVKAISAQLPDEILTKYYGCGSPIPDALEGCTVLDLGCGTG